MIDSLADQLADAEDVLRDLDMHGLADAVHIARLKETAGEGRSVIPDTPSGVRLTGENPAQLSLPVTHA